MTEEEQQSFFKSIGLFVETRVMKATAPLLKRIEEHEARIVELESRHYLKVWQPGITYKQGRFVTHDGSMWHCNVQTVERPGDSGDWTLAVKKGRDGRERAA